MEQNRLRCPLERLLSSEEGDVVSQLFIVCSGRVKISCTSKQGKTMSLKIVGPGEVIGLSSALAGSQSEICAKTIEPCTVNVLRSNDFLTFIERYGEASLIAAYALAEECKAYAYSGASQLRHFRVLLRGRLAGSLLEWGKTSPSTGSCGLRFNIYRSRMEGILPSSPAPRREIRTLATGKLQTDSLIEILRNDGAHFSIQRNWRSSPFKNNSNTGRNFSCLLLPHHIK